MRRRLHRWDITKLMLVPGFIACTVMAISALVMKDFQACILVAILSRLSWQGIVD